MLKEIIDDALTRGEKLKKDIVGQILKSATLNELVHNKKFAETIAKVIQTKDEITRTIQRNVHETLRAMSIPSRQQLSSYERRIDQLERKINTLGRDAFKKKLKSPSKSRRKR